MICAAEHCEDSFTALKGLGDGAVDIIITDPPYSEHCQANLCSGSLVGTKNVPKYELPFAPLTEYAWLKDAIRVAKRWVVVFCTLEDFGRFEDSTGRNTPKVPGYVRGCVWYKPNSMGQLTADRPATSYEGIALFHGGGVKKRWNGRGSYGIWKCNGTRGKKDRHPNEKPIDLCLKLVSLFSERGEIILDPFCGSGAIGEAACRLGRSYAGLDKDAYWSGIANNRVNSLLETVSDEYALSLCSMKDQES